MVHNVPRVCDTALSPTRARSRCADEARRSAAEPEAPASDADAHYALLCAVVPEFLSVSSVRFSVFVYEALCTIY
jgi:hypothetical protein